MSIKLVDTLEPMASFPIAMAENIDFADGKSLQEKYDSGKLVSSAEAPVKVTDGTISLDTVPITKGGTGVTTQADINKAFINSLEIDNSDVTDGTEFVSSWASNNGFVDPEHLNKPFKRKFSTVWSYIQGKISSILGLTVSSYSGKAATAGTADTATACSGNSATATKATQDSAGQQIDKTYIKELSISGKTITYTKGDKTTGTLTTQDTIYSAATQSSAGLMSAADKTKLDGIAEGANKTTVDSALSSTSTNPVQNKIVNSALSNKVDKVSGKGLSTNDFTTAEKEKLSGITAGANNYTLPVANNSTLGGVKTTSTVTSASGLTACPIIDGVPYYKDTNTTYSAASTSIAGLMSAADKKKLDSIAESANKTTVDSVLSSTSTNPVQNKAINTALGNKVDKVSGKGLSTNDFTGTYKTKLDGIAEGANNYSLPTANNSTLGGVKTTSTVTSTSGLTACPIINGVPYYKDTNTVYTHPTTEGNKHIPSGGSSGQILRWSSAGTAVWGNDNNTTYSNATTTTSGLMSAADKKKLDDLEKYTKEYKVSTVTSETIKYIKLGEFNPTEGGNISCRITGDNFDDTIDINILGGNFENTSVSGYYSKKSKRTLGIRISGTVSNNIGIYLKINQLTTATVKVAVDKKYQSRLTMSESGLGQYEGILTDIYFSSYNGIFSSNADIANNLSAGSLTTGKIQAENRGIVSLNSNGGMVIVNSTNNTTGGLRVKQKMVIPIGEPSDLENGCIWVG